MVFRYIRQRFTSVAVAILYKPLGSGKLVVYSKIGVHLCAWTSIRILIWYMWRMVGQNDLKRCHPKGQYAFLGNSGKRQGLVFWSRWSSGLGECYSQFHMPHFSMESRKMTRPQGDDVVNPTTPRFPFRLINIYVFYVFFYWTPAWVTFLSYYDI